MNRSTAWPFLALLAGLFCVALQPAPEAEPPATGWMPVRVNPAAAMVGIAAPVPALAPAAPASTAALAATRAQHRAPLRPADMPYRFLGRSASGTETSIVLMGRGRVVTVRGAQALDDEYSVEAVFDDYLVLRHLPSGVGKFLAFTQRQGMPGPARDPEQAPRD